MAEKGKSSHANTKRKSRQRQRYRKQQLFLCIVILFFVVLAIRSLTKIYVIEGKIWGAEQKVQAADIAAGRVYSDGNTGVREEYTSFDDDAESGTDIIDLAADMKLSRLNESEKQEWDAIYQRNKEILILVNKEYPMTKGQELSLRTICNGRLEAADCLYEDLCKMLEDAAKERYEYWISSAYRSQAKQQQLIDEDVRKYLTQGYTYDEALKKTYEYVMPAGYSEHQTGLALDILCAGNIHMDDSQADEPGNKWLRENCHKYGFILRYPQGKESITGIRYEAWHFRYVGKEAAEWLKNHDMSLEEALTGEHSRM